MGKKLGSLLAWVPSDHPELSEWLQLAGVSESDIPEWPNCVEVAGSFSIARIFAKGVSICCNEYSKEHGGCTAIWTAIREAYSQGFMDGQDSTDPEAGFERYYQKIESKYHTTKSKLRRTQ